MKKTIILSTASLVLAFSSYAQLSGVKTINPNGSGADNYTSFTTAVAALQAAGVNGSVTFNVTPGVYQERFTVNAAATAGAGATNQIIFQKAPAAIGDVFVRPNTEGASIINLYDASWVTLDGINLEDGGDAAGNNKTNRAMQLSGAQHCTFKNFTIRMNSRGRLLNTASRGITSGTSLGGATRPLRYNNFDNLRIVSVGNRAFSLFSDFASSATNVEERDRGNVVTNCLIDSIGGGVTGTANIGLFFLEQDSLVFKNNRITNILHQPTTAIKMSVLQVRSNPNNAHTRGVLVENNQIGGATGSFIGDDFDGFMLSRTEGAIVRNNIISNIEANSGIGLFSFENQGLICSNNVIRSIAGITGGMRAIVSGSDSAAHFVGNKIADIKSESPTFYTYEVVGIEVQRGIIVHVTGNKIDSVYSSELSDVEAAGMRISAAISSNARPEGGKVYVSNNFVTNVYQQEAEFDSESVLAYGIRSINFVDAGSIPITGGQQHYAHNTIVLNRPEAANLAHKTVGAFLYGSSADAVDAIQFINNILINRNTHEEGGGDTSFVIQFRGETSNFIARGNNYSGHNGTNVLLGADTASIFPFFTDWNAGGYEVVSSATTASDTVAVTFVNEADGDLHLSEVAYTTARLRKGKISWVTKDIDGTNRAADDTQVGADAQNGEQNQLIAMAHMSGYVFNDLNNNGIKDANETPRANIAVRIPSQNYTVFTDSAGFYEITFYELGTYTTSIQLPLYYLITQATPSVTFTVAGQHITKNFPIVVQANAKDFRIRLDGGVARPGFDTRLFLFYENVGTVASNAIIKLKVPTGYTVTSSSATYNTVNGDVVFNLGNVPTGASSHITVDGIVSVGTPLGTILTFTSAINEGDASEITPVNNADTLRLTVVGSYDPNDKQGPASITPTQLAGGRYLDYTIRFQNTGTYYAQNVVVIDTLVGLQANTLELVASSHNVKATVRNNIARFEYLNIYLPDSNTNEIESHGFVKFRVKPNTNLMLGDVIKNKAAIYFDFNAPIITNTVNTVVAIPTSIAEKISRRLEVYPNPLEGEVLTVPNMRGASAKLLSLEGKELRTWSNIGEQISLQNVASGMYLLEVLHEGQRRTAKVVVK